MKQKIRFLSLLLVILFSLNTLVVAENKKGDQLDIETGDIITFGNYMIHGDEMSPIEWIVLEKNKNRLTLLSEKILDFKAFHDEPGGSYWPQSSLRKWLNKEFLEAAFDKNEQKAISRLL